jgi:hypothetical protein
MNHAFTFFNSFASLDSDVPTEYLLFANTNARWIYRVQDGIMKSMMLINVNSIMVISI